MPKKKLENKRKSITWPNSSNVIQYFMLIKEPTWDCILGVQAWKSKIKNQEKIALSKTRFFLLLFMEE